MFMHHHPITPINEYEPLSNSTHDPVNSEAIGNQCSSDYTDKKALNGNNGNNEMAHHMTSTNEHPGTNPSN